MQLDLNFNSLFSINTYAPGLENRKYFLYLVPITSTWLAQGHVVSQKKGDKSTILKLKKKKSTILQLKREKERWQEAAYSDSPVHQFVL